VSEFRAVTDEFAQIQIQSNFIAHIATCNIQFETEMILGIFLLAVIFIPIKIMVKGYSAVI